MCCFFVISICVFYLTNFLAVQTIARANHRSLHAEMVGAFRAAGTVTLTMTVAMDQMSQMSPAVRQHFLF